MEPNTNVKELEGESKDVETFNKTETLKNKLFQVL